VSKWKRKNKKGKKGETVSQMSFVFSCKISEEAFGLTHLRNILDKVMWSLKARPHNPMDKLIWEFCKKRGRAHLQLLDELTSQQGSN
jgi:hypothetical protein